MKHMLLLENGTVGSIDDEAIGKPDVLIGEVVTVQLHDENGNPIEVEGIVVEVLE